MSKWFWTIFSLGAPDLATLLHDVATCVEWTGQTHATYRNRVAKCTQYVVTQQCCKMLRWNVASVWPGLKVRGSLLSFHVIETSSWNIWVVRPGRQLNMLLLIEVFFFNQQYNLIRQIASCVSCSVMLHCGWPCNTLYISILFKSTILCSLFDCTKFIAIGISS